MFLKSLEIRGFKSFADKTELRFKKGVTAVVGPNGSGKSNISDSVRWVLGEQSVKTLRGGKMEDVIFAGTQYRKPVGLAQVSLTLDNEDGSLSTEYHEVTVTRRIFRSGETEYLLNGTKCRLKDITQLFMDTGIGKEGYSLIGQGKIEAVLSGTLNFIFNEISAEVPFSETVRRAKEQGYSEPDPRIDLSGKDVVRKLVILTREAGYKVEQEDVEKKLFVPDEFFNGSIEDFWKNLPNLDADFEEKRQKLEAENKRWRFVAKMDHGKTSVSLESVGINHPFYGLEGSNNIVLLTTERYKEYPMQIQGYGAGAGVTAAGVFANIMSIANI